MSKRSGSEKQRNIPVSMVIIVVFLVLAILSANLIYVRYTLRKQVMNNLELEMGNALRYLEANLSRMKEKSAVLEGIIYNVPDEKELSKELAIARSNSALYRFYYVSSDRKLYRDDGTVEKGNHRYDFLFDLRKTQFDNNYYCAAIKEEDRNDGVFVAVWKEEDSNGNLKGFFITEIQIKTCYVRESFPELDQEGNSCLIESDGKIIECRPEFYERFGEGENAYELITNKTDGTNSQNNKILTMRRRMSALDDYEVSCRGEDGKQILVKAKSVQSVDNLYLMVVYRNGMMEEIILPAILAGFITYLLIILVLFSVILLQMMVNYRNNARMEELAYKDEVTGGWNLNYFKLKSDELIFNHSERAYAIIRFDIANFRYINESYGHISADAILRSIATRFEEVFSNNELCARINSDQFLALVLNDSEFPDKNRRYIKLVGDDAKDNGVKYPIRFKRGIYTVRREDTNLDIMIDHANAARKSLKGDEKVLEVFYSENIIKEMKKNDEIVSSMQNALSRGEFKPYLQPKFDIFKDQIVGAEILVRWEKPDGTKVFPSDFIPIFEQNGFIEKLDFYMLERLCEEIRKYKDSGKYKIVPISINQSRVLLNNPEYLTSVDRIMKRYDTSIEDIQIEITESVFFNDRDKMISVIDQLKEMGLVLCMDDFGSGYSSLNLLKDVPFDILKIDKDFFSEVDTSKDTMIIMQKIVEMARALGIKVVCEGVETQEQIDMLKEIGCRMVQGYYYSKPIPFAEFMDKYLLTDRTGKEKPAESETEQKDGSKQKPAD